MKREEREYHEFINLASRNEQGVKKLWFPSKESRQRLMAMCRKIVANDANRLLGWREL